MKKYTVKYILELKGRQSSMVKEGLEMINANLEQFKDKAKWKSPEIFRGKFITRFTIILNSS